MANERTLTEYEFNTITGGHNLFIYMPSSYDTIVNDIIKDSGCGYSLSSHSMMGNTSILVEYPYNKLVNLTNIKDRIDKFFDNVDRLECILNK